LQVTHNLAERNSGDSIVAVVEDENGIKGYGEGTPREYVTGEKISDSLLASEILSNKILQESNQPPKDLLQIIQEAGFSKYAVACPSVMCAIEIACLDLITKKTASPIWHLFSQKTGRNSFEYSAVLPILSPKAQDEIIKKIIKLKIQYIKFKINKIESGLSNLALIRKKLGPKVNIRVDANGALSSTEAIEFLKKANPYSLSGFEQPVPKNDIDGLARVAANNQKVLIIADESLCNINDAKTLIENRACQAFNIRLSKCGGFLKSIAICQLAKKHNIRYQIGCHVGESSILSAAGRQLAALCPDILFLEGSFSKYMLEDDVIDGDISFGMKGEANLLPGPGLGININFKKLQKYGKLINIFTAN
jgi:muconate cycloisomerase